MKFKIGSNNTELMGTVVRIDLKENANILQQKRRPIPIHLQDQVADELKRLIKNGYLEKATEIIEYCFVSPAVITVKEDKSIKIALDSKNINEATIKLKAQLPNREELISRISRKISEEKEGEILITNTGLLDYAYGQLKLDEQTKNQCIFTVTSGEYAWYYRFLKGFYGLADIPTVFPERIDKTIEFKHPDWLDDIIIVTKGSAEKHETEVKETMKKLEEAGYRLNPKKCEFFKEAQWIGHKLDQNGIQALPDKLEAITNIDIPKK